MNDEELLARMRAIDPARTSDAPQPDINRLLEATMTADTTVRTSPAHRTAPAAPCCWPQQPPLCSRWEPASPGESRRPAILLRPWPPRWS